MPLQLQPATGEITGCVEGPLVESCQVDDLGMWTALPDGLVNGDVYFRTKSQDHKLDRCRVQFKLLQEMDTDPEVIVKIIDIINTDNK